VNDEKKDPDVYLQDILSSMAKIKDFTQGMDARAFSANALVQDAVIRNIEIIGEAASKLPADFRKTHKEMEWGDVVGMRNKLIHAYSDVDSAIVWDVVAHDLPRLEEKIRKIMKRA